MLAKSSALKFMTLSVLLGLLALNAGCEQETDRVLASAQSCLDKATDAASANLCASKVQGLEIPEAYLIRCSANFIAQGFTGERVAKAYEKISNSAGGAAINDPTLNLMAFLIFTDSSPLNTIAKTVENCSKSGSTSMGRLSKIAELATTTATLTGLSPSMFDPLQVSPGQLITNVQQALDNAATLANNVATAIQNNQTPAQSDLDKITALGQVAIGASQAICGTGSALANNDICMQVRQAAQQAGGFNDPVQLADRLMALLAQK